MGSRVDLNVSLTNGHFIIVSKDGRNLFQRLPTCIRIEEPHDEGEEETRNDQTEVELPSDARKGSGCGLEPDDIGHGEGGDTEADALGPEVRWEDLGDVAELGPIDGEAIEDAKDEHHGDAGSQGVTVVGTRILSYDSGLGGKRCHTTHHADCHVLWPWESIHQQHGKCVLDDADRDQECEYQELPMCVQAQSREDQGCIVCKHHD